MIERVWAGYCDLIVDKLETPPLAAGVVMCVGAAFLGRWVWSILTDAQPNQPVLSSDGHSDAETVVIAALLAFGLAIWGVATAIGC